MGPFSLSPHAAVLSSGFAFAKYRRCGCPMINILLFLYYTTILFSFKLNRRTRSRSIIYVFISTGIADVPFGMKLLFSFKFGFFYLSASITCLICAMRLP